MIKYQNDSSVCSPQITENFSYKAEYFTHPYLFQSNFKFAEMLFKDIFHWDLVERSEESKMNTFLSKYNCLPNVKSAKNIKTVKFESVLAVNFQKLIISYSSNFGVTKSDPNVSMKKTLNFFNKDELREEFKKHGFDEKEVDSNCLQFILFISNKRKNTLAFANIFLYNAAEKSMTIVAKPYVLEGFANCGIDTTGGRIELQGFFRPGGEYEESSGFEKFFVNICGNSKTPCDGRNYPVTNDYFGTCGYLGTDNFDVKLLESSNPGKGAKLTYKGGMNGGVVSISEIDFICDAAATTPRFRYVQHRYEDDMFIFEFQMEAAAACPGMGHVGAFGGYYPPLWPVGFGGLGLILAVVGFIAYCIIGALVNKFKWKMEGLFIIPNWPFWKVLPFLFKDGVIYAYQFIKMLVLKIKAKIKGESYESFE
eukprot:gene69-4318_t